MLKHILCSLLVLTFAHTAVAADEVTQFADGLAQQALNIAKSDEAKPAKQAKLETLFKQNVNIKWVAQFVAGKHWRTASAEQKADYLKYYEAFLLKNYASKLTDYSGQSYKIIGSRDEGDGESVLTMELINTGEPNVMLDYRIRKEGSAYQVIDIVVEGVSMITTQRSEFGSVISQKGFDFLISALKKKSGAA